MATLHEFEGTAPDRAAVKITNAGDGLSEALGIDPEEIELGERRAYILQGTCVRVSFETDTKGITTRVHTIKADGIAPIGLDDAKTRVGEYAERVARRKAEVEGQLMLDAEVAAEERERADAASTGIARNTTAPRNPFEVDADDDAGE